MSFKKLNALPLCQVGVLSLAFNLRQLTYASILSYTKIFQSISYFPSDTPVKHSPETHMLDVWFNSPWKPKTAKHPPHTLLQFEETYDEKVAIHAHPQRPITAILQDVGIAPPFASRHAAYEGYRIPRNMHTMFFTRPKNMARQHEIEAFQTP
jgi:hypothetical protein